MQNNIDTNEPPYAINIPDLPSTPAVAEENESKFNKLEAHIDELKDTISKFMKSNKRKFEEFMNKRNNTTRITNIENKLELLEIKLAQLISVFEKESHHNENQFSNIQNEIASLKGECAQLNQSVGSLEVAFEKLDKGVIVFD
jgi:chromosome segregation ATPase